MSPDIPRRKKPSRKYTLVMVSDREGGTTRNLTIGRWALWSGLLVVFCGIAVLTIAALVYTPLGGYVHIPNPGLERKYGGQLQDTQEKLERLAEDILILRDYNNQLRKVLGGAEWNDTSRQGSGQASLVFSARESPQGSPAPMSGATAVSEAVAETSGRQGFDPTIFSEYQSVVTSPEGFRAVFPILVPVEGFVTRSFDPSHGHYGMDFAAKRGTPVYAVTEGFVLFAGWTFNDGNMIILAHGSGYLTVYKHNQSLLKTEQGFVKRGEIIALLGDTGKTSGGPHLHFELWKDGAPLDPQEFMLTTPVVQ